MRNDESSWIVIGCYGLVLLSVASFWGILLYFAFKTLQHFGIL